MDDPAKSARATAILTLVGFINIPIIKFSVDWWNTLHQPASVFRLGGSTIDPSLLWPLLVMAIGFTLEHDLHRCVRRVRVLDRLYGAERGLRTELGRLLQARGRVPRPGAA